MPKVTCTTGERGCLFGSPTSTSFPLDTFRNCYVFCFLVLLAFILWFNLTLQATEGTNGSWVLTVIGSGGPDEQKCIGSEDVEDPTEIPSTSWACELS